MGFVGFQGAGIAHSDKSSTDDLEPCDGIYTIRNRISTCKLRSLCTRSLGVNNL